MANLYDVLMTFAALISRASHLYRFFSGCPWRIFSYNRLLFTYSEMGGRPFETEA